MKNTAAFFFAIFLSLSLCFCSKKTGSGGTKSSSAENTTTVVKKTKTPPPKIIVVNDNAAQKTVDGRYYYDLNGKRYWRNNKDGKYYLFNKAMYNNPDFQKQ